MAAQFITVDPSSDPSVQKLKACQGKYQASCKKATINLAALDTQEEFAFPGNVVMRKTKTEGDKGLKVCHWWKV